MTPQRPDFTLIGQIAAVVPLPAPAPDDDPGRHVPGPLAAVPLPVSSAAAAGAGLPRRKAATVELSAIDAAAAAATAQPGAGVPRSRGPGRQVQDRTRLSPEGEADIEGFLAFLRSEGRLQDQTALAWSYGLRSMLRGVGVGADGGLAAVTADSLAAWWLRPELVTASREHYAKLWAAVRRYCPTAAELPAEVRPERLSEDTYLALARFCAATSLSPLAVTRGLHWTRELARVAGPTVTGALAQDLHARELGTGAWLQGRLVVPRWIGALDPLRSRAAADVAQWIEAGPRGRAGLRGEITPRRRRRWGGPLDD